MLIACPRISKLKALASFSDYAVKVINTFTLVLALAKSLYIYIHTW